MATIYSDWVAISATTNPVPLEDEPRNFRVEEKTHNSIKLAWDLSERGDEEGYEVQKDVDGAWVLIAGVASLNYVDTGLEAETIYNYRIRSRRTEVDA